MHLILPFFLKNSLSPLQISLKHGIIIGKVRLKAVIHFADAQIVVINDKALAGLLLSQIVLIIVRQFLAICILQIFTIFFSPFILTVQLVIY